MAGLFLGIVGVVSCGATALPGFVCSAIAIRSCARSVVAWLGLAVCSPWLFLLFLTWAPPEHVPRPLHVLQFRVCFAPGAFWLGYGRGHLVDSRGEYWFIGGAGGALHFRADRAEVFNKREIIAFAEKHGWKYLGSVHVGRISPKLQLSTEYGG